MCQADDDFVETYTLLTQYLLRDYTDVPEISSLVLHLVSQD